LSIRFFTMYLKVPIVLLALIEGALLVFAPYLAAAVQMQGRNFADITSGGSLFPTALMFGLFGLASLVAVGLFSTRQRSSRAGVLVHIAAMLNATALSALVFYFVEFESRRDPARDSRNSHSHSFLSLLANIVKRPSDGACWFAGGERAGSLLELRRRSDTSGFGSASWRPGRP
jgi:hypothetical protein